MPQIADIHAALKDGDRLGALRIASQLRGCPEEVSRAWQATSRPEFYRELGKDPEALIAAGLTSLEATYGEASDV
jgi:hypothetical protein